MPYVVTEPCISVEDHGCVDACPVDCFYESEDQLVIHPEECIDCGACVPECPVNAIYEVAEVPEHWRASIAKNTEPFKASTSPRKALTRDKWEALRRQAGSIADLYYQTHPATERSQIPRIPLKIP